ncbi:MAG: riboflavin synthase [Planctomycetota bacterium]
MFTGLVQAVGRVLAAEKREAGLRLTIGRGGLTGPIATGDSVCISGVCLTVVEVSDDTLAFDAVAETLDRSTLGGLGLGDRVNLETALTASQPLGGHFVQGHVDGFGEVTAVADDPLAWRTTVRAPEALLDYLVPKGSVTVDGVSLTIASLGDDGTFDVALIPETLERTTLDAALVGTRVNLEMDVLTKTVVQTVRRMGVDSKLNNEQGVTMDTLREAGFAR